MALTALLVGCGSASEDRAPRGRTTAAAGWPTTPCASLGLERTAPLVGRCTQDGERVTVVERGTAVRAGAMRVKMLGVRPQVVNGVPRGTYTAQLEVENEAIGPHGFTVDAELAGGGRAVRFDAGYVFEGFGDFMPPVEERQRITPGLPLTFELSFDARQLGGPAPAVLTQTLRGARPDQPQRAAFLLRPVIPTLARNAPRRLRRTASGAPGTPVRVGSARAVMPPGWVRADDRTAARAFPGRVGGAREAHFSAWVPADGTAPGPVIVLQAISQPGIGDSVDLDPDTFFGEIKEGFEEQVGRERAGAAYRRGTDLGGRPAGLLVGWGPGEEAVAVQMLAAARGDAAYTVTAFGPAAVNPRLEAALAALRASWSWR